MFTISGFNRAHSYPLDAIDGFYQLIGGSYEGDRPINNTGIKKIHLKSDCNNGSNVKGTREPNLYSFALSLPPGHKLFEEPGVKFFKKINKSILSHITFYFEDDDYKPVYFNKRTIIFTCQLIEI